MNDALYIAATGMQAQQLSVDTIANNLANINTSGFKMSRVSFSDMMYRDLNQSAGLDLHSLSFGQGMGVSIAGLSKLFSQGELRQTDAPLDVAIQGNGFLEIALADGTTAFSRGGSLQVNRDGFLTNADGNLLKPNIHVGIDAKSIAIGSNGRVMVVGANQSTATEVGRIEMVNFSDPSALLAFGHNTYGPSERSGDPASGMPGDEGFGVLAPGFIETSNVKLVDEMVNLMIAQRAYGMSVKVIQAADDLLSMSNNLRR
jgi:flagellar basal-body rod protein FlgG